MTKPRNKLSGCVLNPWVQWSLHMVMDRDPSITSHSQLQMTSYLELVKQLPRMDCLADLSA